MSLNLKFQELKSSGEEMFCPWIDFELAEKCEEILNKIAIDFYEWRSTCSIKNIDQYTNKETFEIYKKEKGL